MIPMTMIGKVRRMFHRQNKSVREIARLTSLSRNTISKYLNMEVQGKHSIYTVADYVDAREDRLLANRIDV